MAEKTNMNWKRLKMTSIVFTHKSEGHSYVELKEKDDNLMFFCCLCVKYFKSKSTLEKHLTRQTHTDKMWAAQSTLMKENPWPFNDGRLFFSQDPLDHVDIDGEDNVVPTSDEVFIIPKSVLQKDVVSDLLVTHIGVGRIGAVFRDVCIESIWCEWFGNRWENDKSKVDSEHDLNYGIVTFPYNYELGEYSLLHRFRDMLPDCKADDGAFFSGEKENPHFLGFQIGGMDDWRLLSRIFSNPHMGSMLEEKHNLMTHRKCHICREIMVPKEDVATLLNRKTWKLLCNAENENGIFHVFHVSCLVLWVLIFVAHFYGEEGADVTPFCYQCSAAHVESHDPKVKREVNRMCPVKREVYRKELFDGLEEWLKKPEDLKNNSVGFIKPLKDRMKSDESGDLQDIVHSMELLHFYRFKGVFAGAYFK